MLTSETLAMFAGAVLSLLFGYAPGLSQWYEAQTPVSKRQVMFVAVTLTAVGLFFASCYTPFIYVECSTGGAWGLVEVWVLCLVANQGAFLISTRSLRAS